MFESRGAAGPSAEVAVGGAGGVLLSGGVGSDALAGLSGMVPGPGLAAAIERLVEPLLVSVPGADGAAGGGDDGGSASGAGAAGADDDGAGLVGDVVDPGERALADAARALVVDGAGSDVLVGLGADVLSEAVAACGRLASWAQWAQAVVAECLARCPDMSGEPWMPSRDDQCCDGGSQGDARGRADRDGREQSRSASSGAYAAGRWNAVSEIACRLGVSRTRSSHLVDRGAGLLDGRLRATSGLHRVGLLDESKAGLLVRRLVEEPAVVAEAVQERVVGRAVHRTSAQVGRDVDKALTALDPDGTSARARRHSAGRHVTRPREAGTGVCEMRILMPRPDAFLVDATLDAIAASARATGDRRTLGQLRADALVSMSLHALKSSQHRAAAQSSGAEYAAFAAADEPRAAGGGGVAGVDAMRAVDPAAPADSTAPADPADLMPDGVPLRGLLTALSDVVGHTAPWWMPSGAAPVVLPPGLTVNVDVTVPLDHLVDLLEPESTGNDSSESCRAVTAAPGSGPSGGGVLGGGLPGHGALGGRPPDDGPTGGASLDGGPPGDGRSDRPGGGVSGGGPQDSRSPSDGALGGGWPGGGPSDRPNEGPSKCGLPGLGRVDSAVLEGGSPGRRLSESGSRGFAAPISGSTDFGLPISESPGPAEDARALRPSVAVQTVQTAQTVEASLGTAGRSVPVPAVVARALAAGGTWRRLVTDPVSGTVVDVGRTRYRPPAALADLVRARDAACTHPGCDVPARGCDVDHIVPWAGGGITSYENLTCLCRAHHRLKHTPGWALTRTSTGALMWRTPTGARYHRAPDGTVTMLPRRTGPRQQVRPAVRVPDALAKDITPAVFDRLAKGLAESDPAGRKTVPVLTTRGPRPGQNPGDFETVPYSRALHELGLTPLLDAIPPF
ncbi:HNH endonuclease signature motif containing protein [Actinomyces massiliensis]|uniref:HNH endonuclease signature motif containing protein n=1 Tax=Actinomyces massiliensis TaxID=461393 RepID=UPI001EE67AA6|nr:HNH endonuclease signature motif containing protein [Actinomyces massiliensis]